MEWNEVMQSIQAGLTGDRKKDISYLQAQKEKFRDTEFETQVERMADRLIFDLLPEDASVEMPDAPVEKNPVKFPALEAAGPDEDEDFDDAEDAVNYADYHYLQGNYEKARIIILKAIQKAAKEYPAKTADGMVNVSFNFPMEELIYRHLIAAKDREILRSEVPWSEMYLIYGSALAGLKQYDAARTALKTAVQWNPVNPKIILEYAETFRAQGRMAKYRDVVLQAMQRAWTGEDLGHCYRCLARYYLSLSQIREAVGCCELSLQYDENSRETKDLLAEIQEKNGKIPAPDFDEMKELAQKSGFPLGPDKRVVGLAMTYADHFLHEEPNPEMANYFLGIVYDLTGSEEIGKMMAEQGERAKAAKDFDAKG